MMTQMQVAPDGTLTVDGVQAHGGSWYWCLLPGGLDVMV